jgi:hypothetical protein
MYTVQDYPPPPSEFLLLPTLGSLYKTHVRNQELPQPGDSRPVMPPSQQTIKATSTQDLDPLPLVNNDHASVLPFEMYTIDPGEPPTRTLNWNPVGFLSQIKWYTNDDRFPLSLWGYVCGHGYQVIWGKVH